MLRISLLKLWARHHPQSNAFIVIANLFSGRCWMVNNEKPCENLILISNIRRGFFRVCCASNRCPSVKSIRSKRKRFNSKQICKTRNIWIKIVFEDNSITVVVMHIQSIGKMRCIYLVENKVFPFRKKFELSALFLLLHKVGNVLVYLYK